MSDPNLENEDARGQALAQLRLKRDAYVKLFGPPGEPTPLGQIVLDDINRFACVGRESIHMDSQGRMDPFTTIYRDGKKAVAERIQAMISWSEYDNGN